MTDAGGLFGHCFGLTYSVEEQARTTLHAHMLLRNREYKELNRELESDEVWVRLHARGAVATNIDKWSSTHLFGDIHGGSKKRKLLEAFDHDCFVSLRDRKLPKVVCQQALRNLRHKSGYEASRGLFMKCPDCESGCQLTNEQAIEKYLQKGIGISSLTRYPDTNNGGGTSRLHAMLIARQHHKNDTYVA